MFIISLVSLKVCRHFPHYCSCTYFLVFCEDGDALHADGCISKITWFETGIENSQKRFKKVKCAFVFSLCWIIQSYQIQQAKIPKARILLLYVCVFFWKRSKPNLKTMIPLLAVARTTSLLYQPILLTPPCFTARFSLIFFFLRFGAYIVRGFGFFNKPFSLILNNYWNCK